MTADPNEVIEPLDPHPFDTVAPPQLQEKDRPQPKTEAGKRAAHSSRRPWEGSGPGDEAATAPARPMWVNNRMLLIRPPTTAENTTIAIEVRKASPRKTPLGRGIADPAFKLLEKDLQKIAIAEASRVQAAEGDTAEVPTGMELLLGFGKPRVLSLAIYLLARHETPPDEQGGPLTLEWLRDNINDENSAAVMMDFVEAAGMVEIPGKNGDGLPGSTTETGRQ